MGVRNYLGRFQTGARPCCGPCPNALQGLVSDEVLVYAGQGADPIGDWDCTCSSLNDLFVLSYQGEVTGWGGTGTACRWSYILPSPTPCGPYVSPVTSLHLNVEYDRIRVWFECQDGSVPAWWHRLLATIDAVNWRGRADLEDIGEWIGGPTFQLYLQYNDLHCDWTSSGVLSQIQVGPVV